MSITLDDFARWIKANKFNSTIPTDIEKLKNLSVLDLSKKR